MTPYPLHRSETSTKILITSFLFFMIGSFTVAFLNTYDKVGRVPNGIAQRYGPDAVNLDSTPLATNTDGIYEEGGAIGGSADQLSMAVAKLNTYSALLDITHPHIFEMPLVILVLCHFLMRTRLANWAKIITYVLSFGGVAGMLATPWLVRYISIRFAPLLTSSAVALGIAGLALVFVPLWDMWVPHQRQRAVRTRSVSMSTEHVVD